MTKGTMQLPGSNGGTAWTGAAFDPDTEHAVTCRPRPTRSSADLVKGNPEETNLDYRAASRPLVPGPRGLPLVKPPYGRITAIDLNRGDRVWMVANGDGPRNHPELKALNLPPLGQAVRAAPIVTKIPAVRHRRRSDQSAHTARRRRAEDPRARQGHREDRVGDRTGSGRDRGADDISAQRQAVHRPGDRRTAPPRRAGSVEPAIRLVSCVGDVTGRSQKMSHRFLASVGVVVTDFARCLVRGAAHRRPVTDDAGRRSDQGGGAETDPGRRRWAQEARRRDASTDRRAQELEAVAHRLGRPRSDRGLFEQRRGRHPVRKAVAVRGAPARGHHRRRVETAPTGATKPDRRTRRQRDSTIPRATRSCSGGKPSTPATAAPGWCSTRRTDGFRRRRRRRGSGRRRAPRPGGASATVRPMVPRIAACTTAASPAACRDR